MAAFVIGASLAVEKNSAPWGRESSESRSPSVVPASHSMTSSARSIIDGGTARPSALAVLRFTIISNLVGNCTGIARFLAAQDAIHIGGGATIAVYLVDSVGEQAAFSGNLR